MTSHCPHLVRTGSPRQGLHGPQPCRYHCALYSPERIGSVFLGAVCSTAGYRSCLRLAKISGGRTSPIGPPPLNQQPAPRASFAEISPLPEVGAPPVQVLARQARAGQGLPVQAYPASTLAEPSPPVGTPPAPALPEQALQRRVPPEPERQGTAPTIDTPSPQPVARRSSRSFTFIEVIVLSLGVAAMFALLLVAAGIAFRVAEQPAAFAQPLSVMTNKMSLLVEVRSPTPTSSPPALAAASALRISLKAHKAAQATAAVAYAEIAQTQDQAGAVSATSPRATATPVLATQTLVPATVAPTLLPTVESLSQPTVTPMPVQPTPTPDPPPPSQTPTPSQGAAEASQLAAVPAAGASPPTRITIPSIGLDVPVRPVGMISYEVAGETRYIWDTLPDTAAFHETSAYPGLPGNTVINGHRDIEAAVFRDLGEVQVGDAIQVFVNEAVGYVYQVEEILVVPHTHASQDQHAANRKLLGYFPEVRLTLVTCEPVGSATHRLVIIARPPAARSEGTNP